MKMPICAKRYKIFRSEKIMDTESVNSETRLSTPDRVGRERPTRDFVRSNMPLDRQEAALRDVVPLVELGVQKNSIDKSDKLSSIAEEFQEADTEQVPPFNTYRAGFAQPATTVRESCGIVPADSRIAIQSALKGGVRWSLMFRPGLKDIVNDAIRINRDPCMLSSAYAQSEKSRDLFLRQITQGRNGIATFDLIRKISHVYYMRVEFVDVLMFHPAAWGFPETDQQRAIVGIPGKERDPVHGWLWQQAVDADGEMADVTFAYNHIVRRIPQTLIDAMVLGKLPPWLRAISEVKADTRSVEKMLSVTGAKWDMDSFLEAGLVDEKDVYLKLADVVNGRTLEPDPLAVSVQRHSVKGLYGLRLSLGAYSRAAASVTPKQVRAMAFQLGLTANTNRFHYYWFPLFVLNYPLPPGWAFETENDARTYVNLESGKHQSVHPLVAKFAQLLADFQSSEFLWDHRGSVCIPCDQCGSPESVLLCSQCTDYFCVSCYLSVHARRKTHWAIPVAGCRYLTESEVLAISSHIPLTNVGFCNRRRFLARSNQSDKTGPCQCEWLHFSTEAAFEEAVAHCKLCTMRHSHPPRLDTARGIYYNFSLDAVTDEPSFVDNSRRDQNAVLRLQRWTRGVLARIQFSRRSRASVVIQKNIRMVLAKKRFGRRSQNSVHGNALSVWFQTFTRKRRRETLLSGIIKLHSHVRRRIGVSRLAAKRAAVIRIQALARGVATRARIARKKAAAVQIQAAWRGREYGPKQEGLRHASCVKLQSLVRGCQLRATMRLQVEKAVRIQAVIRAVLARTRVHLMVTAATLIQTTYRRFVAIAATKLGILTALESAAREYDLRVRTASMHLSAVSIQSQYRRHLQRKKFILLKESRLRTSRSVLTILGMFGVAVGSVAQPVHPWYRYLPESVQARLAILKGVIQRSIVHTGEFLVTVVMQVVVRDMLIASGVDESDDVQLEQGRQWSGHGLGHMFDLLRISGDKARIYARRKEGLGIESIPVRMDEPLLTLAAKLRSLTSLTDSQLDIEPDNFTITLLRGLHETVDSFRAHFLNGEGVRSLILVSQLLVTYREFLSQPRLKLDSNLSFQGVDTVVSSQLLDILGYELGVILPTPQWGGAVGKTTCGAIRSAVLEFVDSHAHDLAVQRNGENRRKFAFFNREEVLCAVKRCGRILRAEQADDPDEYAKFSRHAGEIKSLLEACNSAPGVAQQEHSQFVCAVVVVHLLIRGLLMRELWIRAARAIQVSFRYYRSRTVLRRLLGPVVRIQSHWRGLRSALQMFKQNVAASTIQRNWRIVLTRGRNADLVRKIGRLQAVWRGAIQRFWNRKMITSTMKIQTVFRGHLTRLFLNKDGRVLRRAYVDQLKGAPNDSLKRHAAQVQYKAAVEQLKDRQLASRKSRAKIAQRKIQQYRLAATAVGKAAVARPTCSRVSVFEPRPFGNRRAALMAASAPKPHASTSEIVLLANKIIASVEWIGPQGGSTSTRIHAIASRGSHALSVKRIGNSGRSSSSATAKLAAGRDEIKLLNLMQFLGKLKTIHYFPITMRTGLSTPLTNRYATQAFTHAAAVMYSFLVRTDDDASTGRPSWAREMPRMYHASKELLKSDLADAVTRLSALIGDKVRGEYNGGEQSAVSKCAEILKSVLLASVVVDESKWTDEQRMDPGTAAAPLVLVLLAAESVLSGLRSVCVGLTRAMDEQFTAKVSLYRGIKLSRPVWSVLNSVAANAITHKSGVPVTCPPDTEAEAAMVKAARFEDFVSDLYMAQFGVSVCEELVRQTMQQISNFNSRQAKAVTTRTSSTSAVDTGVPFQAMLNSTWSDDAEIRSIVAVFALLVNVVRSRSTNEVHVGALVANTLSGLWKSVACHQSVVGLVNLFTHQVVVTDNKIGINSLFTDGSVVRKLANSGDPPSTDAMVFVSKIPFHKSSSAATMIQSCWRGRVVRKSQFKTIYKFMQFTKWPVIAVGESSDGAAALVGSETTVAGSPVTAKSPLTRLPAKNGLPPPSSTLKPLLGSQSIVLGKEGGGGRPAPDLLQADHIACCKLYFIIVHCVFLKILMVKYFTALVSAVDTVSGMFSSLLAREDKYVVAMANASAELKRIAVQPKPVVVAKKVEKPVPTSVVSKLGREVREEFLSKKILLDNPKVVAKKKGLAVDVVIDGKVEEVVAGATIVESGSTDTYMKEYMKLNDGDDSLFRDISPDIADIAPGPEMLQPVWLSVKATKFALARSRLVSILKTDKAKKSFADYERAGEFGKAVALLCDTLKGNFNVLSSSPSATVVKSGEFWIENVYQVIVGFVAMSVRIPNGDVIGKSLMSAAVHSFTEWLTPFPLNHRNAVEAMIFDTGIGFANAFPDACREQVEAWFTGASQRYLRLVQPVRFGKSCVRYSCVLSKLGVFPQAIFYLSKCIDNQHTGAAVSVLTLVAKINRAVVNVKVGQIEVAEVEIREVVKVAIPGTPLAALAEECKRQIITLRQSKLK